GNARGNVDALAIAQHLKLDRLPGLIGPQDTKRMAGVLGCPSLDREQHVALFESVLLAGRCTHDEQPLVGAEILPEFWRDAHELERAERVTRVEKYVERRHR